MRQSTRLIVNSISTFGRMACTVGISLYVTRLLLQYLGEVDFGLVLALGATGSMLQFLSSALTTAVQRQLSYEIARNDPDALARAFTTGWAVYMLMGLGLWAVGFALTPAIMNGLNIPPDRLSAAWWVYQISLLNLVLVVTASPYQALIVSHQHLTVKAINDFFTVLSRLVAVLLLIVAPWDRMVAFVAFQLIGYAVVRWTLNLYCIWRYEGSLPKLGNLDRAQFRQILSIGLWSLFSNLSMRFRMQGGMILLNVFFGPVVNAAYGIALQLVSYVTTVSNTISMAVLPAIVGAYTKGNRENMHRLALVAGKYIVFLLSPLLVPLMFEAELILRAWLGDLPDYTTILSRLTILWLITGLFTFGYNLANTATGDLGWYTKRLLLSSTLILVVAGVGFYFGLAPWFLPVSTLGGVLVIMAVAVVGIGARIELAPRRWICESLLPTLAVLTPATLLAGVAHLIVKQDLWRLAAVTATFGLVAAPLIWLIGLSAWERQRFVAFATSAVARIQQFRRARSSNHA